MRTWERVTFVARCGACGTTLGEGMLVQWIHFSQQKRRLARCEDCAEGAAPLDVPPLPARMELTEPHGKPPATFAQSFTRPKEWTPYAD